MTKEELLRLLEPFADETEVIIQQPDGKSHEIDHGGYGTILPTEYGCLLLHTGAQVIIRNSPAKERRIRRGDAVTITGSRHDGKTGVVDRICAISGRLAVRMSGGYFAYVSRNEVRRVS